jgi:hypothetical protein
MDLLRDLATDKPIRSSRQSRAALTQRLAQVENLITIGRQQFARQLTIVTEIERSQGDLTAARETLHLSAQAHAIRLDDRDRLAPARAGLVLQRTGARPASRGRRRW